MDSEIIDEIIDVGAVFGKAGIKPKWFVWEGRKYALKEVAYTWKDTEGNSVIMHFSVTDGATQFELTFNQKSMVWRLARTAVV
jgi:hypothetical protein